MISHNHRQPNPRQIPVLNLSYVAPDPDVGEPASLDTDTQSFRRTRDRWQMADGSGGTNWFPGLQIGRVPQVGPRDAFAIHHGSYTTPVWTSAVVDGVAGTEAETVELEQAGRRYQETLNSPVGAWVVAFDGRRPATIRVRGPGTVLYEDEVLPQAR